MAQMTNSMAETTAEALTVHDVTSTIVSTPLATDVTIVAHLRTGCTALVSGVSFGAFGGLTWAAALRAWMVVQALQFGEDPHFTWRGTFAAILLPAALMGALLGAAAYLTKRSGKKRWRWAILAPLLLVVGPLLFVDDFILTLITTGMGSGAILVALIGLLGGYAFSGFGRRWMRWGLGILMVGLISAALIAGGEASPPSADDVFSLLYFVLLMVVLIAGVSVPSRL